jgi:putative SOS response-associated peptidase YedK
MSDDKEKAKCGGSFAIAFAASLDGGKPFAFAGLWEYWPGPKDGRKTEPIESCTIITTDANRLAAKVHDRMPVILNEADYDCWLDPSFDDRAKLEKLIKPFPVKTMTVRPVSTYVNNVKNQGEKCTAAPG